MYIYIYIYIYNNLPQWVVDAQSATHFQKMLIWVRARAHCPLGRNSMFSLKKIGMCTPRPHFLAKMAAH